MFRALVKPDLERIPKALAGGKSVLRICGAADSIIISDIAACGFDGLSLEEGIKDMKTAVKTAQESGIAVIVSVSTSRVFFRGSLEDVKKEAFTYLESGVDVLAPECGLAPETPLKI